MDFIFHFIIFIFGLIVGSFLNCVIYRLALTPKVGSDWSETKESFLKGRSFCPNCRHILNWYDLVPILSFIILGGRCRYCQKKISFQYPLVELATGILFVLILYNTFPNFLLSTFYFLVSSFLIIIFVYDLKHFIIPDKVVFPTIGIVFLYRIFEMQFLNSLAAAFGGGLFFLVIFLISRGRWMGFGDVKLAFLMGLFLNFPNILVALFSAFILGAIIGIGLIIAKKKNLKSEVPFGPFLITGTFIALFYGEKIINWYLNLFFIFYAVPSI